MINSSLYKHAALLAVVVAFGITFPESGSSQEIVAPVNTNEQIFLARTKQFNEFLDRFNYKTTFTGDPVDSAFKSKLPRNKMISSLFDLKDKRTDQSAKEFTNEYTDLKNRFIIEVVSKNSEVPRYSGNIIAEARSRVIYKGTPHNVSVFLAQEVIGESRIKWVILDVKGEVFNFLKSDTTFIRFIPPSSNETDFMNLKRALEDVSYLQYYAAKDYHPDYLTLFFYLINSGAMKFEYVNEVIYHITDIPGWCMKIKEFNRNELNSGWLISDLSRNSLDRSAYIRSLK
ncbi:MAG TPA: hypothetical protein VMV47_09120 [Bacteroidales bacterium]|nr:hypothetical protein [Bacteroidales bacterium]